MSLPEELTNSSLTGLSERSQGEVMAVITAAVVAYGSSRGETLKIRSVRKATGNSWAVAGIRDCIISRKLY